MKKHYASISILLSALSFSCSDDSSDDPAPITPAPQNPTPGAPLTDGTCPNGTTKIDNNSRLICSLQGTYTNDLTLTQDTVWVLSGGVFVGEDRANNSVLTIEPGTTIVGQSGADFLVINRGSQINAQGTAESPIVFTSGKAPGSRARGDWGGLIINGNAPINGCNEAVCEAEGEGNTGLYGGDQPEDNSGVLRYVRVEFAGNEITPDNELNGIAFQGVGSGTTVEYIQVHYNADDGVEFFGGTVNAKYVVLTGNRDDSLDWVNGWTGAMQYVLVEQADDQANSGIEADNLKQDQNLTPRSNPTLANMTLIGTRDEATRGGFGMHLRRGTSARIYNSIVANFKLECLNLDDASTFDAGIEIYNTTLRNCGESGAVIEEENDPYVTLDWFLRQKGNSIVNELGPIDRFYSIEVTDGETMPEDSFIEATSYQGAINGEANDWTAGWTTSVLN